ncbi:CBS domain-containing protein [Anabaena sp. CCY 9402-a]|uniref:CBS domain-containing protein n=1 Tax=Anabaena sp. CCY 9402-a TaxID=3103867 RepID=UPI0039C63D77
MNSPYAIDLPTLDLVIQYSPWTVTPDTLVIDVIGLMNRVRGDDSSLFNAISPQHDSCALIVEGTRLVGIFTLQDVVYLTALGRDLSEVRIAEVMTQPVISLTLAESENALTALLFMRQHQIRHLPVVDTKGELIGLITQDRIRQVVEPAHLLKFRTVAEVMVTTVVHAPPTASVLELAQLMRDGCISCIVIVAGEQEKKKSNSLLPVGIITERDIVNFQLQRLDIAQTPAEAVMSQPICSVSSTASLWTVKQLMQEQGVRRVIVVGEQGELQGLVTQTNLLQIFDPAEILGVMQALQKTVEEQTVQLREANEQLQQQVRERQQVEASLQQTEAELELRVAERTAELVQVNTRLRGEIAERKKAEVACQESEQRLQLALWAGNTGIWDWNLKTNQVIWSENLFSLFGVTPDTFDVSYENFLNLIVHPEDREPLHQSVLRAIDQQVPHNIEFQFLTPDGKVGWSVCKGKVFYDDTGQPFRWTLVRDELGKPQSILVVNTDITEKKQLEQQFYRAQRLESVGTLASGIAHDLNNVFAPIMMIAQLLPSRCKNVDARTQELFQTLENSSQRGANLVKQILTFARGTEGKPILLQPGHLLKELVKVIKQTFPKSIEIQTHIPTNTLWMVKADPTQLEQVFMNLAVNARDAMPNGGILTISAENRFLDQTYTRMNLDAHPGDYIVVTVSDTGTGIPPELLEHIFEPFFTTKELGTGTGLGLATVLGIVKNHAGFVEVSSQVDKGTQFQVYLPIGEGTLAESRIEGELPRGNGELILVVDDELVIQETTKETLENYNYKTLVANDGIEAIALYAQYQQEISAVLLDMLMPNMDGLTTIRTLKTLDPEVKIIATSGLPANCQKALFVGATAFLSKPYTARDLLTTFSHK